MYFCIHSELKCILLNRIPYSSIYHKIAPALINKVVAISAYHAAVVNSDERRHIHIHTLYILVFTLKCSTFYTVPDAAPENFRVVARKFDPGTLILTWQPVRKERKHGEILSYSTSCGSSSVMTVMAIPELEKSGEEYSQEVSGLKSNVYYSCRVLARTSVGDGPAATAEASTGQHHIKMGFG